MDNMIAMEQDPIFSYTGIVNLNLAKCLSTAVEKLETL